MSIDWNSPNSKISEHFTVKEALWLPQWNRMADATDGLDEIVKQNLIQTFAKLDLIRLVFGKSITVHCAYRPDKYNTLVKGAKNSAHKYGQAVDFDVYSFDCDEVREVLKPKLEELQLRMEDLPKSNWVHIDTRAPINSRFFRP